MWEFRCLFDILVLFLSHICSGEVTGSYDGSIFIWLGNTAIQLFIMATLVCKCARSMPVSSFPYSLYHSSSLFLLLALWECECSFIAVVILICQMIIDVSHFLYYHLYEHFLFAEISFCFNVFSLVQIGLLVLLLLTCLNSLQIKNFIFGLDINFISQWAIFNDEEQILLWQEISPSYLLILIFLPHPSPLSTLVLWELMRKVHHSNSALCHIFHIRLRAMHGLKTVSMAETFYPLEDGISKRVLWWVNLLPVVLAGQVYGQTSQ